jgi:two-component system chemotaxis response regulator CheY
MPHGPPDDAAERHETEARVKALVIDDSGAVRGILREMLAELGFDTAEAVDGAEALQHLEAGDRFDVAMVDWNMPGMNGLEFVSAVRADHAYDGMLVAMVTTETEMVQVVRALDAGANEYVMKPFTKEVIAEKLQILGLVETTSCRRSAFS